MLLFVATSSELAALREAAKDLRLPFIKQKGRLGTYYRIGVVGTEEGVVVRTRMGAFAHDGSAASAIHYMFETQATAVVSLGMAFGCLPERQRLADVLVSTGIIPYDFKTIKANDAGEPEVDYSETTAFRSRPALEAQLRRAAQHPK